MNDSIKIGEINTLRVDRPSPHGFFLMSADENSVLLPKKFTPEKLEIDDMIDVFIYTDSEDRLIATTQTPKAKKDEFAFVKVVDVAKFGAFVDIGLDKDLLVPKNRQKTPFQVGDKRIIRVIADDKSNRLIGVEKITSYILKDTSSLNVDDEVEILVFAKTPLGFKAIVNNLYEGMLFSNEVFEPIKAGDIKKAYIKNIREDGKLDLILRKSGMKGSEHDSSIVIDILKKNKNMMNFTYKSDSEDIRKVFGLSKKAFKATLTKLIEQKIITLSEDGIKLHSNE